MMVQHLGFSAQPDERRQLFNLSSMFLCDFPSNLGHFTQTGPGILPIKRLRQRHQDPIGYSKITRYVRAGCA
jgi:hypothetical protein